MHLKKVVAGAPRAIYFVSSPDFLSWVSQDSKRMDVYRVGSFGAVMDMLNSYAGHQSGKERGNTEGGKPVLRSPSFSNENVFEGAVQGEPECIYKSAMTADDMRKCGL